MQGLERLIGHTLGQYRIVEQIGEGGMATVFKAYQPALDRYVAVKVLPPFYADQPGFNERFVREARAIARLNHPNILPVYDFGQEQGYSFIVMRYVEDARTLREVMQHRLDPATAVKLISQVAAALDHAHARQIIHRDVKPSNVLMDGDWALLSDFGLARMVESSSQLTGTGVGIGTPAYMSPEQGQALPVDHRTDIYALGIILFEMLTGQIPHHAETPFAIILKRLNEPLPLPRSLNPAIPEAVERVILKALAREPGDRFESAGALVEALRHAVADLPVEVTPTPAVIKSGVTSLKAVNTPAIASPPAPVGEETVMSGAAARPKRRVTLPLMGAVLALLLLAVIGSVVLYNYSGGQSSPTLAAVAIPPSTPPTPTTSPTLIAAAIPPSPTPTATPMPPTPTNTPIPPTATAAAPAAQQPAAEKPAAPAAKKEYKDLTVCYPQLGAESDWRTANSASLKETAQKLGVKLIFSDAQQKQENQISAMRACIQQKVDVIALPPVVEDGWDAALTEAKDAGIPVIIVDRSVSADKSLYAAHIGSDMVLEGQRSADEMNKLLPDGGKIVELSGTTGSGAAVGRAKGFRDKLNKNIEIIDSQTGNFTTEEGKPVMEAFLKKYAGQIQGAFIHNDNMAIGAVEAMKAAGVKPDDIKVVSIDGSRGGFQLMIDGWVQADVECNPLLGPQVMEMALKLVNGEKVDPETLTNETVYYPDKAAELLPSRQY